jgi:hypothetical protein
MSGLSIRGTVEGFYGPPWTHAERRAHLEYSARVGLTTYVFAPKDDPYHRARWSEPYPPAELTRLAELAGAARDLGVRFVYAISPGLSMRYTDDDDQRTLAAKAAQAHEAGIGAFALFFDDVPAGPGAGGAHGETCSRFVAEFLAPRGIRDPLIVCPTDYAGLEVSDYRRELARTAPPDALVAWTGRDVVVGTVTRDEIDRAAASYERRLVLWDNFPVNDFEPSRLFLGPLTGRPADPGPNLVGVLANPMVWAAPSRIPLASVADWARDPGGYDPASSARRALSTAAGAGATDLAPLVRVCSSWPPSAPPDADLARAIAEVRTGALVPRLTELAAGCRAATEPDDLVTGLRPWLDAGVTVAEAGLATVRLLEGGATRGEVRRALDAAESHYANVLRDVIPPFVREVLDRTAPPAPAATTGPVALLVTGARRTAGDEVIAALLGRRGYTVDSHVAPPPDVVARASIVVVTREAADPAVDAVAGVGVPLVAWHGFVRLGLARAGDVYIARDRLRIVAPDDPLAAGRDGIVPVYSGPDRLTVADVGPDARVVARVAGEDRPALFHYPAGATLADGSTAPAPRTGLFLAGDGPAPWLLTGAGRAMVAAALS